MKGILLLTILMIFIIVSSVDAQEWNDLSVPSPQRGNMGYAYDSEHHQGVIFGGDGCGGTCDNTFLWNGKYWKEIILNPKPSARRSIQMTYDAVRSEVILFGGWTFPDNYFGDTWTFNGTSWTLKNTPGPPTRANNALAYDKDKQKVVLFGGSLYQTIYGDTWEWDGTNWRQVSNTGPPPRIFSRMVYDETRKKMVLFGGATRYPGTVLNDTWEWDGNIWHQVATTGPSPRLYHQMVYDPIRKKVILYGGIDEAISKVYDDTWEWDGSKWTRINVNSPGLRYAGAIFFDDINDYVVLSGGYENGVLKNDTWMYLATNSPFGSPPPPIAPIAATAAGTTVMIGVAATISGGTVFNQISIFLEKLDEFLKEYLKNAIKFILEEKLHQNYLFSWDEIPGNDSRRLMDFLKKIYRIDWVKTAKIEKIDNDQTIIISIEKNYLSLSLNNDKTKVNLKIDDIRTDELIAKMVNGKLNIYQQEKDPADSGDFIKLIIGGGIIFFAFAIEKIHESNNEYEVDPLIFLLSLAFFAMIAEIGHNLAFKFSLKSVGSNLRFELSLIGAFITITSGFLGFVIAAAGGTKVIREIKNSLIEPIVTASGSFFNLMFGILLLFISISFQIKWLAIGALPNLAYATFCLFPTYPFEGRKVFKGNKFLWGLLFFFSLMFYLLVLWRSPHS